MHTITVLADRSMNVLPIKRMVIEEDSINTVRFIVPMIFDGKDLTTARWYILLLAEGNIGDMIELTPYPYSDTQFYVDWFLTGAATARSGDLSFAIRAETGVYVYQTYPQTITIDSRLTLDGTEEFAPSILQQYLQEFAALRAAAEDAKEAAEKAEAGAIDSQQAAYGSEQLAKDYANKDEDDEVTSGMYSAKHWAAKAQGHVINVLDNAFEIENIDEQDYLVYTY